MQEKHSAINSAETPLICNATLTCLMLRRWTAPLPQNKIYNNKTFDHEKAFKAELDFIQDKVVIQKEILQFSTLCLLYTQELDRNGFPNPDYKSEKKMLESHPIHEQMAHVYVKHCGSVFCGLIHSSEISVAGAVTYA